MTKYLTKKEVAELLHCSVKTVDRYRYMGILPYIKMGPTSNAKVLFEETDIQDFVARRKHNSGFLRHGEGWQYNSGFGPDGKVVSGSKEERGVEDAEPGTRWDDDYSDKPPEIY